MDTSKPDHIGHLLANMVIGERPLMPDAKLEPCALCGTETTHKNSIKLDQDRQHFSCREKVRVSGLRLMLVHQDVLSVCEALRKDRILACRLEKRLEPYLENVSADKLCRMITFCLGEIDRDPSIRPILKQHLKDWLTDIRGRYLPSTN